MNLSKRLTSLLCALAMIFTFMMPAGAVDAVPSDTTVVSSVSSVPTAAALRIQMNKTSATLVSQKKLTLSTTGTTKTPVWSSSNISVATVNSQGVVTGIMPGTAVITASVDGYKTSCTVKVIKSVASLPKLQMNRSSASVYANQTLSLAASNTEGNVTWSSSRNSVATVNSSGVVTAVSAGTAVITATDELGRTVSSSITVIKPSLSKTSASMSVNDSFTLSLTGGSPASIATSNQKVATVTSYGKVTAVGSGSATITVTDAYGAKYTCAVKVSQSYLQKSYAGAVKVYSKIVQLRCRHAIGTKKWSDMINTKKITCAASATLVLQEAGILPVGKIITHTPAVGSSAVSRKNTPSKAIKYIERMKKGTYKIVKAGVTYSKLPAKYKQPGMMYVYDSTFAVSAGGGSVYTASEGPNQYKGGHYYKTKLSSGYCFTTPILYIIAPNG